jgi:transposase
MHQGKIVLAQLLEYLPRYDFNQCVARYQGNRGVREFSCLDQYISMAFAQLTGRDSLRDTITCLQAMRKKLYHAGFRSLPARSTLAEANEKRDWRIYADFAQVLIKTARTLYLDEEFGVELHQTAYALDSTTIDLCLSLFPWAHFRKSKAAVKMHTLLDLRGNIPVSITVTTGKVHDVNLLDQLPLEPGAIYIFDRGYLDFLRLYRIHQAPAFFVTRSKKNTKLRRIYSHPADSSTGVRSDQTVTLVVSGSKQDYPEQLRRIRFIDQGTGKRLTFLTNNFLLPAEVIAQLYQKRWQVELFFKWIKQHLHIKAFFGTTENAVKTQIWIAVSIYVLVAIVRKQLKVETSLYTILQVLDVALFEKMPILQAFSAITEPEENMGSSKQLMLFDI